MFTTPWFRRRKTVQDPFRGRRRRGPAGAGLLDRSWRYLPRVEQLEERCVPSVSILNGGGSGYAGDASSDDPPDTCGAAGPSSYIEVTNNFVQIYTPKATGTTVVSDGIYDFFYNV